MPSGISFDQFRRVATTPGCTVNRLCASGLQAVVDASRAITCGEGDLYIAGGVESMSRAPFVLPKAAVPFARGAEIYDTTMGWRFVNPALQAAYGTDSMGETAEIVAAERGVSRADQDAFALRSQQRAAKAQAQEYFEEEITPVPVPQRKGDPVYVSQDEHPRETDLDKLTRLRPAFRDGGTVTSAVAERIAPVVAGSAVVPAGEGRRVAGVSARGKSGCHPDADGHQGVDRSERDRVQQCLDVGAQEPISLGS